MYLELHSHHSHRLAARKVPADVPRDIMALVELPHVSHVLSAQLKPQTTGHVRVLWVIVYHAQ